MKTSFKAKIIIEYKTKNYLVADETEPNFEQIGKMIEDGNVDKTEWIFDWLQNGSEPVLVITEKYIDS